MTLLICKSGTLTLIPKTLLLILITIFFACSTSNAQDFTEDEARRHNEYFEKGSSLIKPYTLIHGKESKSTATPEAEKDISEGIQYLNMALEINPDNWSAYWLIGKGFQALNNSYAARSAFEESYKIMPENTDVIKELMIETLNTGSVKKSIDLANAAIKLNPDDPGLKANLALALLVDAQLDKALVAAQKALEADPDNSITRLIFNIIKNVESGEYPHLNQSLTLIIIWKLKKKKIRLTSAISLCFPLSL